MRRNFQRGGYKTPKIIVLYEGVYWERATSPSILMEE